MRSMCVGVAETGGITHMRSMCVGVAETGGLTHMRSMCVGVAETGGLTHMRSMCVGVAEMGGLSNAPHCLIPRRPAMIHKETFPLSYFCMTKSTKSHIRGVPPLIYLPPVASRRLVRTHFPDRPAIAEPRLQVRNAQAPTRIHCCAMSGYGKPRGSSLGACLGANIAR